MASVIITPNMNLPNPVPGVDTGPDYADNLSNSLNIVDLHNHSPGSGVQINPSGMDINSDLSIAGNNLTFLRTVRFSAQSAALAGASDLGCLYEAGVDLYYNDGSGNQIRITQGGSVTGSTGTITGLPSGTASASYAAGTFVFQSATNTSATIDGGSFILRNNTASSKGLTLSPPNAMAANYALTLPSLPVVQSIMSLDSSGTMAAPYTVDNSTIVISSNVIQVPGGGIGTAQIANLAVTAAKIANATITTTQISATAGIVGTQLAAAANILESQLQQLASAIAPTPTTSFTTTSTTFVGVTNSAVGITGIGRPILFNFACVTGTIGQGYIGIVGTFNATNATFRIRNTTDNVIVTTGNFLTNIVGASGGQELRLPLGVMNCIDFSQPVGAKQYALEVAVVAGTSLVVNNCTMSATAI